MTCGFVLLPATARSEPSPDPFSKWAQASVERPLTLPDSMGEWKVWSFLSNAQSWSWFPLAFEYGVNDDLTLVWLPIPIELRWRFFRTAEQELAATLNVLGATTSQTQNFNWSPFVRVNSRWHISHWLALDSHLAWVAELRRETTPVAVTGVLGVAPRLQPWRWMWISLLLETWLEFGAPRAMYWGAEPTWAAPGPNLRVPFGGVLGFSLWNRLELENRLTVLTLGFGNGYLQLHWSASLALWF